MTQLQRLTLAAVLVLLVTMSAFAGEIPIPGAIAPPPSTMTAPGEIQVDVTNTNDSSDYVLEGLEFRLLQTLLTLY